MMKGRLFCLLFSILLVLSGCASDTETQPSLDECREARPGPTVRARFWTACWR